MSQIDTDKNQISEQFLSSIIDSIASQSLPLLVRRLVKAFQPYAIVKCLEVGIFVKEQAKLVKTFRYEPQHTSLEFTEQKVKEHSLLSKAFQHGPQLISPLSKKRLLQSFAVFSEVKQAFEIGAQTLIVLPLQDSEEKGYFLCGFVGTKNLFSPSLLRLVSKLLLVALKQVHTIQNVAMLSQKAYRENQTLKQEILRIAPNKDLFVFSESMKRVLQTAALVAPYDTSVLIEGESGTGKELIAHRIHRLSKRSKRPFLRVNCGALPETLAESELFGHEKGSFTGANQRHIGLFERANGGTLFLDEVIALSLTLQVKLLRVLQEGEFIRVGGEEQRHTNVRMIAATHPTIEHLVKEGKFREDLYYRLRVFPIKIPSLRERQEEIPSLAQALLNQITHRLNRPALRLNASVCRALQNYSWPGNVRELENRLEHAVILSKGPFLTLPEEFTQQIFDKTPIKSTSTLPVPTFAFAMRQCIENALLRCGGKIYGKNGAAALLALKPSTLQSKMKVLGISKNSKNSKKV